MLVPRRLTATEPTALGRRLPKSKGCIEDGGTIMSEQDPAKLRAAEAAAGQVETGMIVGLGTGTTASAMVRQLGLRVERESLRFIGVATSAATAALARSVGITLRDLDDVETLDLNLDGADEVDGQFRMVKGHGGALLREKISRLRPRAATWRSSRPTNASSGSGRRCRSPSR